MNFFDDDFGLSTPILNKKVSNSSLQKNPPLDISRKSAKKDEFDDLLDSLLDKDSKRNARKKQPSPPYTSTQLDAPSNDFKKTQKWSTPNINDIYDNRPSPKFPPPPQSKKPSNKSYLDDLMSEDNRSNRSGRTGKISQQIDQFDNLNTIKQSQFVGSNRNMRPPRRSKEKESKQPSIMIEDDRMKFGYESFNDLEQPKTINNNSRTSVQKPQIKEKIIEKIVHVKQEDKQLKKRHQEEISNIKSIYQRQIKMLQQTVKKQQQQNLKTKDQIINRHREELNSEKTRNKVIIEENTSRLNQLHHWQLTKKIQTYQIQLQKYKHFATLENNLNQIQKNSQQDTQRMQIRQKESEIERQRRKIEQTKEFVQSKMNYIDNQIKRMELERRKDQNRNQQEERRLLQKESQIKKEELEKKRSIGIEKQNIANELAEAELDIAKKKEEIRFEKETVKVQKQLLHKERQQFENFSRSIMTDYKIKLKEVQTEKQHIHQLQLNLHQKIQAVEMMAIQTSSSHTNHSLATGHAPPQHQKQNIRDRINSEFNSKITETKDRFKEMQTVVKQNEREIRDMEGSKKNKVNVKDYVARLNRSYTKR